jgi:undecaprenyl-diphosphatase
VMEFLSSIDVAVFFFINHTCANPVFDVVMPFLTDLNKMRFGQALYLAGWLWLIVKGGRNGRAAAAVLLLGIIVSDQLSSTVLKPFVGRIRPCHALEGVRLLGDCGSGLSFPSSHAVNNFCAAVVLAAFYKPQRWLWFSIAALVAFTRPYVGVHYPSDILGGALIGAGCGYALVLIWRGIDARFFTPQTGESR